jgi:hypothetical protein
MHLTLGKKFCMAVRLINVVKNYIDDGLNQEVLWSQASRIPLNLNHVVILNRVKHALEICFFKILSLKPSKV